MRRETSKITRRHRLLTVAVVLREAGTVDRSERERLAQALWAGWREVMQTRLGAALYGEWQEGKRRTAE